MWSGCNWIYDFRILGLTSIHQLVTREILGDFSLSRKLWKQHKIGIWKRDKTCRGETLNTVKFPPLNLTKNRQGDDPLSWGVLETDIKHKAPLSSMMQSASAAVPKTTSALRILLQDPLVLPDLFRKEDTEDAIVFLFLCSVSKHVKGFKFFLLPFYFTSASFWKRILTSLLLRCLVFPCWKAVRLWFDKCKRTKKLRGSKRGIRNLGTWP